MTVTQIIDELLDNPKLLKQSTQQLAARFKSTYEDCLYAREAIKTMNSKKQELVPSADKVQIPTWLGEVEKEYLKLYESKANKILENCLNYSDKTLDTNIDKGEIKGTVTLEKEITDPDDFYDIFDIDRAKWKISRYWLKTHKSGKPTYSIDVRSIVPQIDFKQEFIDFLEEYEFSVPELKYEPIVKYNNLLVVCLFDLHLGRESQSKSVLEHSSLQTQKDIFRSNLISLMENASVYGAERILLPIGNDFFNCEYHGATSKGTPQDNTKDIHGMFKTGLDLLTWAVDFLSAIAPVDVLYVPSNHDQGFGQALALSLEKLFENHTGVFVNALPTSRKYYKYGINGLMFEHGELSKAEDYALIFATEGKSIYADTENHEVLLGHRHHEHTKEIKGIMIRWLGSLSSTDRWHFNKGYIGKKRGYCLVYNKDCGKISEFTVVE